MRYDSLARRGSTSLWSAVALTLLALFACGAAVTQVTVRSWWYGGLRMTVLGGGAAAVTYAVGGLVGAAGLG